MQTKLGNYATKRLNKDFGTDMTIAKVGLQLNGDVELKEILIRDHHQDTLIRIGELNTSIISYSNLYNGKLNFGYINIEDVLFNLKAYKGENDTNLDVFVDKFDDGQPRKGPSEFLFASSDISIENGEFLILDENLENVQILDLLKKRFT